MNLVRAKRISGWMTDKELEFLASTAQKSRMIIEIGSYYGRSCMAMADNTEGVVVSVDPYKGEYPTANGGIKLDFDEPVYHDFLYNLSEHIQARKVRQFRGVFADLPIFAADFVFIDGDHSYEGCYADIKRAMQYVKTGVIAGHDWGQPGFPGVEKSVLELLGKPNVVDSIWWVQR